MEDTEQPIVTAKEQKLTYRSMKDFVEKTRKLLRQEEQYEIELFEDMTKNKTIQEIEGSGFGLSSMTVVSTKKGFYGKTILTLTKTYHSDKNPQNISEECKVKVGDDVALFKNNTIVADGVVYKRVGPKLQVSIRNDIDDDNDLEGLNCNVVLKWNEVTYRRYFGTLNELEKAESPLLWMFFPDSPPSDGKFTKKVQYQNKKLNAEQNQAVQHCIGETVHLLHGPPGTGKTTTVCEVIAEAVRRGEKVLACAPSNIAVDNIVEGLSGRVNCIRVGNPARMIQNVIERCLDFQISKSSNLWKAQVKKLQNARKRLTKSGNRDEKRSIRKQIKQLRDQIYQMQEQIIKQILSDTDVICCTNVGAADRVFRKYLPKRIFDLVVIDQCGQSLQISCWIPILKGRRVVLAGDHKQLPPTIQGNQNSLLSYTLFSRSMEQLKNITSTMLRVQYRMNKNIMGWSNQQFYQNKLKAHQSVENHTLKHLYGNVDASEEILMMVDTSGCGMGQQGGEDESKMNVGQADIAIAIYKKLLTYQVEAKHIAILTPYSKQVSYIKGRITQANIPIPDISTVDGIQGRQKQCIIISMVRSNKKRQIGFLKDWRRMNVAVTRARRMLVLIGNVDCVTADKHIFTLVKWVQENGHICSAEEFRSDESVRFGQGASDKIEKYQKTGKLTETEEKTLGKVNKKNKNKQQGSKGQHKEHSEEEQNAVKEHFKKVFTQIQREITINNASAFERKMIHQIAEEMNLCHETSEDKKFIKVWRKLTAQQVANKYAQQDRLLLEEELAKQKKKKKKKTQNQNRQAKNSKPNAGGNQFSQNMKELIGEQSSEEEQKQQAKTQEIEQTEQKAEEELKVKKKKNKNKNKAKQEIKEQQDENIDQIMKQFMANQPKQNQCYKCKKKITSVTAAECKYCGINFCRMHLLAEQHGCDQSARVDARRIKPFDKQLKQAAEKLKLKIKEQEESRKRKPKQTKQGKK